MHSCSSTQRLHAELHIRGRGCGFSGTIASVGAAALSGTLSSFVVAGAADDIPRLGLQHLFPQQQHLNLHASSHSLYLFTPLSPSHLPRMGAVAPSVSLNLAVVLLSVSPNRKPSGKKVPRLAICKHSLICARRSALEVP